MSPNKPAQAEVGMTLDEVREEILRDYRIVFESREASLLGRKEVLTGKAKFGIFGDGKELAQVAWPSSSATATGAAATTAT
jgi:hypothetical protein